MAALYEAGATLEEVGRSYGLTRERIRQVLRKYGFDVGTLKAASRSARQRRKTVELEAFIGDRLSAGEPLHKIASAAGVSLSAVGRTGLVDPDLIAIAQLDRKPVTPLYSDMEVIDCLKLANQELGGVMTSIEYEKAAANRMLPDGRNWPGRQTAMGRFGSWRTALMAAGLPANPSSAIAGKRQYEMAHCIDAILEVERYLGRVPTAREYERYARLNGGLPSLSTVRHRHGQWHLAVIRAIAFRRSPV